MPGITFVAGLPMSIVETCKSMAGNARCRWSSGVGQRVQHRDQPVRGVVGEVRVGGMALHALDREPPGQAAAPADLDHVAEVGRGRLADNAGVERLAARGEPFEHLGCR